MRRPGSETRHSSMVWRLLGAIPFVGLAVYYVGTLHNIFMYLVASAAHQSGENYLAYEVAQLRFNFIVRLLHTIFPVAERPLLAQAMLTARSTPTRGFELYSFWEIAVLDLVLGPLLWLGLLLLLTRVVRRATHTGAGAVEVSRL
jgi:hypothetical protein